MTPDGYPDEVELQTVKDWQPPEGTLDFTGLMEYVHERWRWPDWGWEVASKRRRYHKQSPLIREYRISTGGWSGNESLIDAMQDNWLFWGVSWVESRRGGHYVFNVREGERPSSPAPTWPPRPPSMGSDCTCNQHGDITGTHEAGCEGFPAT